MTITDFIPYGRENAISRQALAQLTGMDDRQVRRMIEDARREVPIINLQNGKGYFRPLPEDREDVVRWKAIQSHRASEICGSMHGADAWLLKTPPAQMKWEV